jgi:hypothetical protein
VADSAGGPAVESRLHIEAQALTNLIYDVLESKTGVGVSGNRAIQAFVGVFSENPRGNILEKISEFG